MVARIYQPAKTAMQSGRGNTRKWIIDFEPAEAKQADELMGWTGSGDMRSQVCLRFDAKEQAMSFAARHGISYQLLEPKPRRPRPKNYADNFRFERVE
ncbi:MAG: ETC complex I subunit [Pseudomonadota bacterium]|nr:ETC complex I subunit [Pseudomonadota bacterium]